MADIIRWNVVVAGLIITLGVYAQAVKVIRTKSAKDISPLIVVALIYNEMSWIIYGIYIREWPILLLAVINVPGDIILAYGYWLYGRKEVGSSVQLPPVDRR